MSDDAGLTRRHFLTVAAGVTTTLLVGTGCSSTYDVPAGFVTPASGRGGRTIVYWNLLSGGDGSHMETMEAGYERQHPKVTLKSTILQWGDPYYTKLAMAIKSGAPPDVAIMHLTRLHQFVPPGLITPLPLDLLAQHGMTPGDFTPLAFQKAQFNGTLYGIPLDTHPFVQYYNTALCRKAGLLDSSGHLPPINGQQQMLSVLRKLKKVGATPVVCDQINDPATPWRLFYTLYSQAGGRVLADNGKKIVLNRALAIRVLDFIYQLGREGLMNANVDAGGGIAVFQSGNAGLYWEGEWNVDVFQQAKLPFSMQPFPALFGSDVTQADSHTFVVPVHPNRDPQRLSMVLTMIRSLLGQSLVWASGGHIPAWLPVQRSAAYAKLKPQYNYHSVANHVVYDPPAWYSGSGSSMENYAGAAIGSVMLGSLGPAAGYEEMLNSFQTLSKETVPV